MLAALSVSMGSMVVGYSSSYTSPGLVSMRDNATASFEVTKEIVSSVMHDAYLICDVVLPIIVKFDRVFLQRCIFTSTYRAHVGSLRDIFLFTQNLYSLTQYTQPRIHSMIL